VVNKNPIVDNLAPNFAFGFTCAGLSKDFCRTPVAEGFVALQTVPKNGAEGFATLQTPLKNFSMGFAALQTPLKNFSEGFVTLQTVPKNILTPRSA
jgi:hypothetical protein